LRGQPQIQVVGEADGPNSTATYECDVALWDVRAVEPQVAHVRFLALLSEPHDAQAWLKEGATGCVLETASVEELLSAIRQVARGETFLSPPIVRELVSSVTAYREQTQPEVEPLTEREREVLGLLAQGLNNKDIAQKLYLSVRTVEGHLANIYGKLHLKSRTEAALWAVQKQ
jgi:DNA-binding NarL/FixJ family response regulator